MNRLCLTVSIAMAKQGIGTILTDDQGVLIDDVGIAEGDGVGTVDLTFTVSVLFEPAAGNDVEINWITADNTAEDEMGDGDYDSNGGTLTFINGGSLSQQITVIVNSDDLVEQNESFYVNLSNPVNTAILDGQGIGTITNHD